MPPPKKEILLNEENTRRTTESEIYSTLNNSLSFADKEKLFKNNEEDNTSNSSDSLKKTPFISSNVSTQSAKNETNVVNELTTKARDLGKNIIESENRRLSGERISAAITAANPYGNPSKNNLTSLSSIRLPRFDKKISIVDEKGNLIILSIEDLLKKDSNGIRLLDKTDPYISEQILKRTLEHKENKKTVFEKKFEYGFGIFVKGFGGISLIMGIIFAANSIAGVVAIAFITPHIALIIGLVIAIPGVTMGVIFIGKQIKIYSSNKKIMKINALVYKENNELSKDLAANCLGQSTNVHQLLNLKASQDTAIIIIPKKKELFPENNISLSAKIIPKSIVTESIQSPKSSLYGGVLNTDRNVAVKATKPIIDNSAPKMYHDLYSLPKDSSLTNNQSSNTLSKLELNAKDVATTLFRRREITGINNKSSNEINTSTNTPIKI